MEVGGGDGEGGFRLERVCILYVYAVLYLYRGYVCMCRSIGAII